MKPLKGAKGSFGEVWEGTYRGKRVAIKKPLVVVDPAGLIIRYKEDEYEAQNAEYVRWAGLPLHPHVLAVYGAYADQVNNSLWLVSPLIANGSLINVLTTMKPPPWLDETWVERVLIHVAHGLAHLHDNNMLHLDCMFFFFFFFES